MDHKIEKIQEETGQTDLELHIPPNQIVITGGTLSHVVESGVPKQSRAAQDADFQIVVPLNSPLVRQAASRGWKPSAVDLYYSVDTADLTDFAAATVVAYKVTGSADGTAVATAGFGGTLTMDLTTTSRKATGARKLVVTLGTPAFIDDAETAYLQITVDPALTSVFKVIRAVVKGTRRL